MTTWKLHLDLGMFFLSSIQDYIPRNDLFQLLDEIDVRISSSSISILFEFLADNK